MDVLPNIHIPSEVFADFLTILDNGSLRGILALIVVIGVFLIYGVSVWRNNEKVQERLLQTLSTIVALIITFYFVEGN